MGGGVVGEERGRGVGEGRGEVWMEGGRGFVIATKKSVV